MERRMEGDTMLIIDIIKTLENETKKSSSYEYLNKIRFKNQTYIIKAKQEDSYTYKIVVEKEQ